MRYRLAMAILFVKAGLSICGGSAFANDCAISLILTNDARLYWECNTWQNSLYNMGVERSITSPLIEAAYETWRVGLLEEAGVIFEFREFENACPYGGYFNTKDDLENFPAHATAVGWADIGQEVFRERITDGILHVRAPGSMQNVGGFFYVWSFTDEANDDPGKRNISFRSVITHEVGHFFNIDDISPEGSCFEDNCNTESPAVSCSTEAGLPTMCAGNWYCYGCGFGEVKGGDEEWMKLAQDLSCADKEWIRFIYSGYVDVELFQFVSAMLSLNGELTIRGKCQLSRETAKADVLGGNTVALDKAKVLFRSEPSVGDLGDCVIRGEIKEESYLRYVWLRNGEVTLGPYEVASEVLDVARPFAVIPNPNKGTFRMVLSSRTSDVTRVCIYGVAGRLKSCNSLDRGEGVNDVQIELSGALADGIYNVVLRGPNDGVVASRKFIVVR